MINRFLLRVAYHLVIAPLSAIVECLENAVAAAKRWRDGR